jgi:hypothetical protein
VVALELSLTTCACFTFSRNFWSSNAQLAGGIAFYPLILLAPS